MSSQNPLQAQDQDPWSNPDDIEPNTDADFGGGEDAIIPGSPDPLSPGRTDVNPSDKPGVDELPNNEGETPLDSADDAVVEQDMPDVDIDNAEMDDQPKPR